MKSYIGTCLFVFASSAALCAQSSTQYPSTQVQAAPQNPTVAPAQNPNANTQPLYLPPGLDIQVRVNESLNSGTAQAGDTFTGTLVNSLVDDNNNIIFERGAQVSGRVISAKPSGRLQDSGELVLSLNSIHSDQQVANVAVASKTVTGASHSGSNATKVGGGALLGAIIGGLAGGGKGAAIGAGVGAGAGAGTAAATGKKEAQVSPESIVRFVTTTETTVVPAGSEAARQMEQQQPSVYQAGSGPRDGNTPVLRRRNNPGNTNDDNIDWGADSSNSQPSGQVATNRPDDNGPPVMRRREDTQSDTSSNPQQMPNNHPQQAPNGGNPMPDNRNQQTANYPSQQTSNPTNQQTTTANQQTASASTSAATVTNNSTTTDTRTSTQWAFSARDKRVINSCLAENAGSVPAPDANAIPYYKGDTLPYAAQKKARSLPLACEKQLPPVSSDQERIIYNQQVLLVNGNSLVLDSFDIPKQ